MLRHNLKALISGILLCATPALAGPDFGFAFRPFPISRSLLASNRAGEPREAFLGFANTGVIAYRVEFANDSATGPRFGVASGEFASGAPATCSDVRLLASGGRTQHGQVFVRIGAREVSSEEFTADPNALAADFAAPFEAYARGLRARPSERDPAWCEALRSRCERGENANPFEFVLRWAGPGDPPYEQTVTATGGGAPRHRSCELGEITPDQLVEDCLRGDQSATDRELAALAQAQEQQRCSGVVLAAIEGDDLELRVVGGDGVEWSRESVVPPRPRYERAYGYLPLAVVADVPFMALLVAHDVLLGAFVVIAAP